MVRFGTHSQSWWCLVHKYISVNTPVHTPSPHPFTRVKPNVMDCDLGVRRALAHPVCMTVWMKGQWSPTHRSGQRYLAPSVGPEICQPGPRCDLGVSMRWRTRCA